MLILLKFIITRDFFFRQITNVDEVARLIISSEIFWTWSSVTKEFKISFIVFLSLNDMKYENYFNRSISFSSWNETSMNISSLNWSRSNLKSDLCFIKIERIFFLYFDSQWSLMSKFKFFSFSDVSKTLLVTNSSSNFTWLKMLSKYCRNCNRFIIIWSISWMIIITCSVLKQITFTRFLIRMKFNFWQIIKSKKTNDLWHSCMKFIVRIWMFNNFDFINDKFRKICL